MLTSLRRGIRTTSPRFATLTAERGSTTWMWLRLRPNAQTKAAVRRAHEDSVTTTTTRRLVHERRRDGLRDFGLHYFGDVADC